MRCACWSRTSALDGEPRSNCYAIFSAGRLALIETGSGDYLLPTAGKLQQNLAAAGIDAASIERVLLTHMHPDHSARLAGPKTGRKLVAGMHMHYPGFAHVVRQGDSYLMLLEPWAQAF